MMRLAGYLLVALCFLLAQTSLLPALFPHYFKPELLLILTIYFCLTETFIRGALLAWGTGLLLDSCGGELLGLHATCYLVIFCLGRWSVRTLNTESPLLIVIMVFCGSLLQTIMLFFLGILADMAGLFDLFAQRAMFQASINVLAAYTLMVLITALQRQCGQRVRIPGFAHLLDERHGT